MGKGTSEQATKLMSSHIQKQAMLQLKQQEDSRRHIASADKTAKLANRTRSPADFA